jgi:hypothetical protein
VRTGGGGGASEGDDPRPCKGGGTKLGRLGGLRPNGCDGRGGPGGGGRIEPAGVTTAGAPGGTLGSGAFPGREG